MASFDITIPHPQTPIIGPGTGSLTGEWQRTFTNIGKSVNDVVRQADTTAAGLVTTQGTVATHTATIAANSSAIATLQVAPAFAHAEYTTNTTISGTIPYDDTIPQIGEGTQILTLSITPTKSNSLINVRFQGQGGVVTAGPLTAALFINGGSDAVQAVVFQTAATGTEYDASLEYTYAPGSTSAQTIAIRVGSNSGNSFMNGIGVASRKYGGAQASTLVAREIPQ